MYRLSTALLDRVIYSLIYSLTYSSHLIDGTGDGAVERWPGGALRNPPSG